ncbi:MAG: hypothetical protein ACTHLB_14580 [Parafilimonas sp.]
MADLTTYHKNFIAGVRMLMSEHDLETVKDAAAFLDIPYQAFWKVMDGTNKPSVENCLKLLQKGDYSANWLFLNKGNKHLTEQATLNTIFNAVKKLSQ